MSPNIVRRILHTQTIVIIIKIAFQSKVTIRECVYLVTLVCLFVSVTLTLTRWPWQWSFSLSTLSIELQCLVFLSMLWATIRDSHKLVCGGSDPLIYGVSGVDRLRILACDVQCPLFTGHPRSSFKVDLKMPLLPSMFNLLSRLF